MKKENELIQRDIACIREKNGSQWIIKSKRRVILRPHSFAFVFALVVRGNNSERTRHHDGVVDDGDSNEHRGASGGTGTRRAGAVKLERHPANIFTSKFVPR